MSLIILILLILLLVGALPQVGLHNYGYGPPGVIGVILIVLLVLVLMGRL